MIIKSNLGPRTSIGRLSDRDVSRVGGRAPSNWSPAIKTREIWQYHGNQCYSRTFTSFGRISSNSAAVNETGQLLQRRQELQTRKKEQGIRTAFPKPAATGGNGEEFSFSRSKLDRERKFTNSEKSTGLLNMSARYVPVAPYLFEEIKNGKVGRDRGREKSMRTVVGHPCLRRYVTLVKINLRLELIYTVQYSVLSGSSALRSF